MKHLFLVFLVLSLSSCAKLVGVGSLQDRSAAEIIHFHGLNASDQVAILNAEHFADIVYPYKEHKPDLFRDLSQPLNVVYLANQEVLFNYPNCYAGGWPILNWNNRGYFNSCKLPNVLTHDSIAKFWLDDSLLVDPLTNTPLNVSGNTLLVTYNYFLQKQSEKLIQFIKSYEEKCENHYNILFVNNDAFLYELDLKAENHP